MGENSHISAEFDKVRMGVFSLCHLYIAFDLASSCSIAQIVLVVLENYGGESKDSNSNQTSWVEEVSKTEGNVSPSTNVVSKIPSWKMVVNDKGNLNVAE